MSKLLLGFLCITCLCSCGFFERKPLNEREVRGYIFPENAFDDAPIDFFSYGAVGGYSFVVRMQASSGEKAISQLDGFKLTSSFAGDDPNRSLILEMYQTSVTQYFSNTEIPNWVPRKQVCDHEVSLYEKRQGGLTVYLYRGVGECDELIFFGTLD